MPKNKRPAHQGLHELGAMTTVRDGARHIAEMLTGEPDRIEYLRDVEVVDPNDYVDGDWFLEKHDPAVGGFWLRTAYAGGKWLHVQVTLLPDGDIDEAERLLDDQRD